MKRKILFWLFAIGLLWQFTSCQIPASDMEEKEEASATGQWLSYSETQCADPWGYCNTTPDKKICVQQYVEKQGFTVLELIATQESQGVVCSACQCPTGRIFKVKVSQQEVAKLEAVGFKKL